MSRILKTMVAAGVLALLTLPAPVNAAEIIDSKAALARVSAGEVMLLDVRSPEEWRETGLPKGAKAVTIHGPDGMAGFVAKAKRVAKDRKDQPIALICARGWRSYRAANALEEAGFTNIINVREGMLGNPFDGPGWLDRKLPVDPCDNC